MVVALELEEVQAVSRGEVIKALRMVRARTGCGLTEAKQVVRAWQAKELVNALLAAKAMANALNEPVVAGVLDMLADKVEDDGFDATLEAVTLEQERRS